ncbi:hypothetical protein [Microbacterium invictum]|uniref:Uncharacterized protein with PQ loop repeat n=1 Tax=Microbacterium invictum TaxID=515415 RepID=A0AA40VN77_9MICO|nr:MULTISPECIES: hypothetical protein [Microbacterium]MBB4140627.1 uncharacterized protein with PQ loop repeat [Microbacterium invictum]
MTGSPGFTDIPPLRRNRRRLPGSAGVLRLVFVICAIFGAAQWIVPAGARLVLNAGQVYPSDEPFSLWDPIAEFPVMSVPAWLTVGTGLVGMGAALAYFAVRGRAAAADAAYVSLVSLLVFGLFPWAIAAFDVDPTGIVHTPGPDGYPIGWHWLATPLSLVVLIVGIVVFVRGRDLGRRRPA